MTPRLNTNKFQVVFPMMPDLATIQDDLLMDSHDLLFHLMLVHEPIPRSPFIQETNEFGGGTRVAWQSDLWLKFEVWDALVAASGIESCRSS